MNIERLESYIEKVYGYAVNNTYSREEADELSQEILFTVIRELPKLKDDSKFEPWLWGVARNVTKSFRRHMGKQRAMYSYDVPENLSYEDQYFDEQEELYDFLRTKIAMLSSIYRDIVILYYYDGLSTKQISEKLHISEGTVTWRLFEARKKIKKECDEMNETALRPVKLRLDIYGNGNYNGKTIPFPTVYINDALSQNILYYCYEEACSVEELAKTCGVPAYYVEERVDNLLKRDALIEVTKGKYQTDFVIWSDKYGIYCEENAEKALLPIMDKLLEALGNIARDAARIDFYRAEKCETDLYYLYGVMAFSYASQHYCKLPYPRFKEKYDGNRFCYIGNMETGKHHRPILVGEQHCSNSGSRGGYSHTAYHSISGITFREMMYDNYINVCEDILRSGSSEDKESLANAIQDGYIVKKQDGSFFVTVPSFTKEQKEEFDRIAEKYLAPLMPMYSEMVNKFIAGYKKLFPQHLNDDADRFCQSMFRGMYSVIIEYGQRTGAVEMPSPNCHCDVMIQFKTH
ncbi:MAG: sigma-70 family RNA polymerase sigma factor [Acetatifactor sp.]|nr:sigma-70 family RNA polymerase sigma factor [Acetatifactor sp.]